MTIKTVIGGNGNGKGDRNLKMSNEQLAHRIWDWTFLNPCFPTGKSGAKITVTDIDGMVEISGHFIFFEVKQHGAKVKTGQRIAYERLVQVGRPYVTVIYLWGHYERNEITSFERLGYGVKGKFFTKMYKPASNQDLVDLVANWYTYARAHPHPNLRRASGM